MNREVDSDVQTVLDSLRERVSALEAVQQETLRRTTGTRRLQRKLLLGAIPVALLLAGVDCSTPLTHYS